MILTCPNCATQYVVKDGAIPPQGRQVRCASCKHSWHQEPELDTELEAQTRAETAADEGLAEATMIEPRSGPEAEERAYEEAMIEEAGDTPLETVAESSPVEEPAGDEAGRLQAELAAEQHAQAVSADFDGGQTIAAAPMTNADWSEPPQAEAADDEFSPFPASDDVEAPGRSPIVTILMVVILVAALAAAFYFLAPPELKAKLGLGTGAASQLALIVTHRDRQPLESGNELLTVTGRVINPTAKEQDVPPLQAQLRSRAGKVVYRWTISPPARTLAAGASAPFNSAEVNVPPGGDELTITLGGPGA
jgi:predicted Zn finger-like uncharacterized protein